jgi:transcription elongation factor Elf1
VSKEDDGMTTKKKRKEPPAVIQCFKCGHMATAGKRHNRLSLRELAGKTLVCTRCGQRQRLDEAPALREAIIAAFRQDPPSSTVN